MDVSNLVVSIGASSSGTVHGVLVGEVSPIKQVERETTLSILKASAVTRRKQST